MDALCPKAIHRLPQDHFVDEVRGLNRPARRYVVTFYVHLLGQDLVSNFFSGLANVRPLHHEISKDGDSKSAAELDDIFWVVNLPCRSYIRRPSRPQRNNRPTECDYSGT